MSPGEGPGSFLLPKLRDSEDLSTQKKRVRIPGHFPEFIIHALKRSCSLNTNTDKPGEVVPPKAKFHIRVLLQKAGTIKINIIY